MGAPLPNRSAPYSPGIAAIRICLLVITTAQRPSCRRFHTGPQIFRKHRHYVCAKVAEPPLHPASVCTPTHLSPFLFYYENPWLPATVSPRAVRGERCNPRCTSVQAPDDVPNGVPKIRGLSLGQVERASSRPTLPVAFSEILPAPLGTGTNGTLVYSRNAVNAASHRLAMQRRAA